MNTRPTFYETAKAIVAPAPVTLIDTTEHPSEAVLFGDDIKLTEEYVGGKRWLVLNQAGVEVSFPASEFAQIARMAGVVLAVAVS